MESALHPWFSDVRAHSLCVSDDMVVKKAMASVYTRPAEKQAVFRRQLLNLAVNNSNKILLAMPQKILVTWTKLDCCIV